MNAAISHRARSLVAYSYDDFPVTTGQLDLRGDNSPPLSPEFARPIALPTATVASYGEVRGEVRLRTVLADLFGVHRDQILVTAGGSEALLLALTCITDHGHLIRMPRPAFPGFEQLATILGLRVLPYAAAVGEVPRRGTMPVLICTPHNPTGLITSPDAPGRSGGWVIWDLSHMTTSGTRIAEFTAEFGTQDIAVFSLSKLLRLPGARVGCLIARDPALLDAAVRAKTHLSMSTSCLAQDLALRVLQDPTATHELRTRTELFADHRARILAAVAASSSLRAVAAADGTHIYVETVDGADAWQRLAGYGVIGIPGHVFNGTTREVRLCIAQPQQIIDAATNRVRTL
ncbi:pyridoxal phosphate-dependent aminotransferase [Nocardia pseudovaccinii]|uniref:pyridoxal phosphate-dependent aminotransferase n=1 Tax=Nocardia pseudovaccinii TaxID=189540 RepID=UPI0007A3C959|nr:pyridoxal phosphate-dependent aminotransferase [Nocardia pseudovaccinii]